MSDALPRQELLIKLMGLTASSNDGEALTALRKATSLLVSAGWDWDKLIRGKITVVEDPFKNLGDPTPRVERAADWTPGPAQPVRSTPQRPAPPPPPPQPVTAIKGVSVNRFPGYCWCCGQETLAGQGFIFKPSTHNPRATISTFQVICSKCEPQGKLCTPGPALVQRKPRTKSVGDLA